MVMKMMMLISRALRCTLPLPAPDGDIGFCRELFMFHAGKLTDMVSVGYIHIGGKVYELSARQDTMKERSTAESKSTCE
jgi:hypothetical protein